MFVVKLKQSFSSFADSKAAVTAYRGCFLQLMGRHYDEIKLKYGQKRWFQNSRSQNYNFYVKFILMDCRICDDFCNKSHER